MWLDKTIRDLPIQLLRVGVEELNFRPAEVETRTHRHCALSIESRYLQLNRIVLVLKCAGEPPSVVRAVHDCLRSSIR